MAIPDSELERLAGGPVSAQSVEGGAILPDECLGIERRRGGLKQNGELVLPYKVSGCRFSEREINGYRAASSAIAGQLESIKDFKRQLTRSDHLPESSRSLESDSSVVQNGDVDHGRAPAVLPAEP